MNYIVLDLEWNQSPSGKKNTVEDIPFEIIQMGAVKLDEKYNIIGEFNKNIRPKVYMQLHSKVEEVVGVTMEELLEDGEDFERVAADFLEWCGYDYIICTWGSMDLTELQRDCNRKYGLSAQKTLDIVQGLYEKRKMVTYPRTDSRFLSDDMIPKLPIMLNRLKATKEYGIYADYVLSLPKLPISKRIIDNSKISDHHAIIPTEARANVESLSADEFKVYDLIARRYLAVFYPNYIYNTTKIITTVEQENFLTKGTTIVQKGWTELNVVSEKEKKITAYHESGHAILFHLLPDVGPVHTISIIPTGMGAAGYTMPLPERDEMFNTRGKMLQNIIVSLGGRIAEELVFDDITTGASQDIKQATETARSMVTKYGFSSKLGLINYDNDSDEVFIGRDLAHTRPYGEEVASQIDMEVKNIIDECYGKAKKMIEEHMDVLEKSAQLLLEKEKVTREEFEALFEN